MYERILLALDGSELAEQALRHAVEPALRRRDGWKVAAHSLILATVIALAVSQAPAPVVGLVFAGAIGVTTVALWVAARILTFGARRLLPTRAPYVVRQGVANLFRPHNQTTPVTLAVGFGVFLLGTVFLVQRNLLDRLAFESGSDRPNLVVFDIQSDQIEGVRGLLAGASVAPPQVTPIVPARIAAINGRPAEELLQDTTESSPRGSASTASAITACRAAVTAIATGRRRDTDRSTSRTRSPSPATCTFTIWR